MNNTEKNKNVVNFRIPPVRMDELREASGAFQETSSNVFCKKIILLILDLHRDGVSFNMLSSRRDEIIQLFLGK